MPGQAAMSATTPSDLAGRSGASSRPKTGTPDCSKATMVPEPVLRTRDRIPRRTFQIILSCISFELSPPRGEISPGWRRIGGNGLGRDGEVHWLEARLRFTGHHGKVGRAR